MRDASQSAGRVRGWVVRVVNEFWVTYRMVTHPVSLESLNFSGSGLKRPECVLAHASGWLFAPSWQGQGGVSCISPNGATHTVTQRTIEDPIRPNGIAIDQTGQILLAHLGDSLGGVFSLQADGTLEETVMTANGKLLPPTNYVVRDSQQRLWITVSTRLCPRAKDYRQDACTGFIAVASPGSTNATIVADGLGYTNEVVVDEANACLYVNETFGRRLTRFELHDDGSLSNPKTLATFDAGTYPDGLALAQDGSLWVTSIVSNRVLVVSPDGEVRVVLEDVHPDHLASTEQAYKRNELGRPHLDTAHGKVLKNISNLAFGGPTLQTAYLGNLLGDRIPYFQTPVAGAAMPHWHAPIEDWTTPQHPS